MRILRIFGILFTLLVLALGVGAFVAFGVYEHVSTDLPDVAQLEHYQPLTATRIHAGDGRLLAEYAKQKRVFIPITAMPPRVTAAFLAAEDRDFYKHGGVNYEAILRASAQNIKNLLSHRRLIGASTIDQQVAKNFLTGDEYSASRKLREMVVAGRIDEAMSKPHILELYLNEIYLGYGAYGVGEAALTYFNKSLEDLTTAECAFLATLPKGPGNYDPVKYYDKAKARRDWVLQGMYETGAITQAEMVAAQAEPIVLAQRNDSEVFNAPFFTEEVRRELVGRFGENAVYQEGLSVRTSLDPDLQHLADQALRDGLIAYDRRHGYRGPIGHVAADTDWQRHLAAFPAPAGAAPWRRAMIAATRADGAVLGFDDGSTGWMPMSEIAWARPDLPDQHVGAPPKSPDQIFKPGDIVLVEKVAAAALAAPTGRHGKHLQAVRTDGSSYYGLRQIPAVSGAIVVLDPHTGRIYAISGGFDYAMGQFDRATQAYRQTGSAIKPIVYLAALDNGMTPSTMILDAPVAIVQGPNLPLWRPENFESDEYLGPIPLRVAIEKSINTATVRMASTIGIDKIIPYIENLGVLDTVPAEYSYVLGAGATTPLRLTTAYAMLVNGGKRIVPSFIDRVQDRNGRTIFKHDTRACDRCGDFDWPDAGEVPDLPDDRQQVLDPATAYQMVNILRGVVQRGTAAHAVGPLDLPLAGKTGTTNDEKDTWFVGFSPDLVCGVYVGFDQPRTLGPKEQGATVAAPIFAEFMKGALADKTVTDFRIPPGVDLVRVDPATGQLVSGHSTNFILEAYKPGTEPVPADEGGTEQVIEGGAGVETLPSDTALPMSAGPDPSAIEPVEPGAQTQPVAPPTTPIAPPPAGSGEGLPIAPPTVPGAAGQYAVPTQPAAHGSPPPRLGQPAAPPAKPLPLPATRPSTGTGGLY